MGSRYGGRHRGGLGRRMVALVAIALLMVGLGSCAKPIQPTELIAEPTATPNRLTGQMAEVSPPEALETLKQIIDAYTPQVRLLSPRPGEVLKETAVTVRLQVRGLPLFKNETWGLGPHLHLFLDGEPYRAIYDPTEPITFENLAPGTHTLRVFASRPWHESFKNQGAYDQRTFHVYAPTPQNEVNAKAPLLTYSRPQGSYGAEPIMLDFYLTNAPLHMSVQAEEGDDLHDWRVRCTVNDQSFVFDQWQPIWLKGFKPGRNWVQLELIDEAGNPIDNRFNNTVRAIDYTPGGSDTLSRLVRGELDIKEVAGIIDPTYVPPAPPEPEAIAVPEPAAPPNSDIPAPEVSPPPEVPTAPAPPREAQPSSLPSAIAPSQDEPLPNPFLLPDSPPAAQPTQGEAAEPTLIEEIQAILEEARLEEAKAPEVKAPEVKAPEAKTPEESPAPEATPAPLPTPVPEAAPLDEKSLDEVTPAPEAPAAKGLLNRFQQWREKATPSPGPTPPSPQPDRFAAPPAAAPPAAAPEPLESSDARSPSGLEEANPNQAIAEEPVDLPRIELPEPEEGRSMPRSPLAPEMRPFI